MSEIENQGITLYYPRKVSDMNRFKEERWYMAKRDHVGNVTATECCGHNCLGHLTSDDAIAHLKERICRTTRKHYDRHQMGLCEVCNEFTDNFHVEEFYIGKRWYLCKRHQDPKVIELLVIHWLTLHLGYLQRLECNLSLTYDEIETLKKQSVTYDAINWMLLAGFDAPDYEQMAAHESELTKAMIQKKAEDTKKLQVSLGSSTSSDIDITGASLPPECDI